MATKKCPNGHQYDSSIYGDNCPFCPESSHTRVSNAPATIDYFNDGKAGETEPYLSGSSGGTIMRPIDGTSPNSNGGRKVVGVLISYDLNPTGDIYKIYEGKTTIGRKSTCDIAVSEDPYMSSEHLLIQYVPAKGVFRAQEFGSGSANGTYVNGIVYVMGDVIDLKSGDVLVLGKTKFLFLAIPEF